MTNERLPVWIDCDPGVDDACALLLASRLDCLEIRGISAVAGNVPLEKTFWNARALSEFYGMQAPVYPGAARPLRGEQHTAEYFHGENGLGECTLPAPERPEETKPAWDALYEEAVRQQGKLTVIALGPMTNLATTLMKYPDFAGRVARILMIVGGSEHGNVTPAAEFNAYADPEAAAMLFRCGAPLVMLGLDVCMKAHAYPQELEAVFAPDTPQANFLRDAHRFSLRASARFGLDRLRSGDSCAVLYAANPQLFTGVRCGVAVETRGRYTRGKTVVDAVTDHKFDFENALFIYGVDREEFLKKMANLVAGCQVESETK